MIKNIRHLILNLQNSVKGSASKLLKTGAPSGKLWSKSHEGNLLYYRETDQQNTH